MPTLHSRLQPRPQLSSDKETPAMNADQKRITIPVDSEIDNIKDFIKEQTGVEMTYVQVFNHLIHFYIKHAAEPRTRWAPIFKEDEPRTNRPNKGK
jgi:hypothetical protein